MNIDNGRNLIKVEKRNGFEMRTNELPLHANLLIQIWTSYIQK